LFWASEAGAVFAKELKTEWRTRVALSAVGLFALASLTLIALGLRDPTLSAPTRQLLAGVLLWVLVFFTAATGLGRTFVQEAERGTAAALRLSARATVVWAGKFAANVLLLLVLTLLAAPILLGVLDVSMAGVNAGLLLCVLGLGVVGLAAVMTTTAALVAQASAKSGLLAALSFPLLVPLFVAGVHGAEAAVGFGNAAGSWKPALGDLQVLGSYAVIAVTASLLLFDFVWND
jgi:heme exporter protein B